MEYSLTKVCIWSKDAKLCFFRLQFLAWPWTSQSRTLYIVHVPASFESAMVCIVHRAKLLDASQLFTGYQMARVTLIKRRSMQEVHKEIMRQQLRGIYITSLYAAAMEYYQEQVSWGERGIAPPSAGTTDILCWSLCSSLCLPLTRKLRPT